MGNMDGNFILKVHRFAFLFVYFFTFCCFGFYPSETKNTECFDSSYFEQISYNCCREVTSRSLLLYFTIPHIEIKRE